MVGCATPAKIVIPTPNIDGFYSTECVLPTKTKSVVTWEDTLIEKAERNAMLLECHKKHKGVYSLFIRYIQEVNNAIK
jgi:hypothetical protein